MSYLWKSEDEKTEVSLGFLVDDQGIETGVVALEVITPIYGTFTEEYDRLMKDIESARHRVFGWKDVADLSSVPLEVGVTLATREDVKVFTIYEELTHRNRYVFVGTPKAEFRRDDMHWGERLEIAAPSKELTE